MYRHSSNMGTVMEFNDGIDRKVIILDAKYRSNKAFGTVGLDSSLTNYAYDSNKKYSFKLSDETPNSDTVSIITDIWINSNIMKDTNTSKQNCDVWMTYKNATYNGITGVPAVEYCRSILVNGVPCDLPNIQILARIFCDANAIDELDPTVDNGYNKFALGKKNTSGMWNIGNEGESFFSNSSTECSNRSCWAIAGDRKEIASVYARDFYTGGIKGMTFSVIPILEI